MREGNIGWEPKMGAKKNKQARNEPVLRKLSEQIQGNGVIWAKEGPKQEGWADPTRRGWVVSNKPDE